MSTIKVNAVENRTGSTLTLGKSGTTIQLACGATQTGFGRTGTVNWCTTAKTSPLTVESGKGYFLNTTCGAITVTLPSSPSAGAIVAFKDYANTFDNNAVTINNNGSKINGICANAELTTESQSVTLIYVDGTKGWQDIHDSTSNVTGASFVAATGGTITTCGNFKIHTFTSDATFCVSNAGNPAGSNTVEYLVVGGGGAGATRVGGGGGAGGFRFYGACVSAPYPASPLVAASAVPVTATGFPVTVGGGGSATTPSCNENPGGDGSNSVFSTITSTGGGGGQGCVATAAGRTANGGSGGGGGPGSGATASGGTGNTPPVSPPQGNDGGNAGVNYTGGGGGGALAVGQQSGPHPTQPTAKGGDGGVGGGFPTAHFGANGQLSSCVRYFSGGGGGGVWSSPVTGPGGTGALGGGATGVTSNTQPTYAPTYAANAGTVNTGGGGGGAGGGAVANPTGGALVGGAGGSGIVVIRYRFQ